jgi:hypothetical protein
LAADHLEGSGQLDAAESLLLLAYQSALTEMGEQALEGVENIFTETGTNIGDVLINSCYILSFSCLIIFKRNARKGQIINLPSKQNELRRKVI